MRFVDEVRIHVISGDGGSGCVSFRHEKFVPYGGPDGGDGGRGGDVVFVATTRRSSLLELRGHAMWRASNGGRGQGKQKTGRGGRSIELQVPVGTRVHDEATGEIIADLTADGDRFVAAAGGAPGRGNLSFKSSSNRAPRKFTEGRPGQDRRLRLELMLMADVGLLGFPNAGKSTLVSRVSAARPKVADYPFTTLVPSLGVVDMGVDGSFVVADVPGLIQGASDGAGLGHQFLRHLSRTRVLLHLLSLSPNEDLPVAERYRAIRAELRAFDPVLAGRPEIIVLTQVDLATDEQVADARAALAQDIPADAQVLTVSSVTGQGINPLKHAVFGVVRALVEP